MDFGKLIEIESRLTKGGLSKKEETKLLIKKMRLLNGGDHLGLYVFLYSIAVIGGITLLMTM